ncbi:WYL domain-containing protein [Marinobacter sp. SS21]|uniref:WYL domain-containing protein n=1 Tax=Marinobacter sp. SS21 TaxID=2979460 RepID=UPI00232AFC79|nr:WYL domain-containing protein [Marinobacter sp. SS21]MDC0661066.1 WYL domain-containing protein [Marinobacter sp. SS21]
MKKTEWPIRWDLLLRYRLIEIIALWEGRLTTNHICHGFGIGRQQASKDINMYLRDVAPGNLDYDRHRKGYVPSAAFKPRVTEGAADEYLELMSRHDSLSQTFESLDIRLPASAVVRLPCHQGNPEVVRAVIAATRQGRKLALDYASLHQPQAESCVLSPHTLVCSGSQWFARGWCDRQQQYRDFQLTRFRGNPKLLSERASRSASQDQQWSRTITLVFRPDRRLTPHQQAVVAQDYGMVEQRLALPIRAALRSHVLSQLGIPVSGVSVDPLQFPLELAESSDAMPEPHEPALKSPQPAPC